MLTESVFVPTTSTYSEGLLIGLALGFCIGFSGGIAYIWEKLR